jgi:N utilization substance protein B
MPATPPAPTSTSTKQGPHRSRQRKARKYALDLLYAADLRECPIEDAIRDYETMNERPIPAYSLRLARGVVDRDYLIDGYLAPSLAENWTVERMPIVDRCLARMACYEMLFADVPVPVAIAEAVGLAQELSTDSSPSFLTGVLSKVATLIPQPEPESMAETTTEEPAETEGQSNEKPEESADDRGGPEIQADTDDTENPTPSTRITDESEPIER